MVRGTFKKEKCSLRSEAETGIEKEGRGRAGRKFYTSSREGLRRSLSRGESLWDHRKKKKRGKKTPAPLKEEKGSTAGRKKGAN